MADVFIGLGSNLGDRPRFLRQALEALQGDQVRVRQCSSFRRTAPIGGPQQPDFVNAVARLEVQTTPQALMHKLLQTEARFGRRRQMVNGPRTLDLDLLLFGQQQFQTEFLTLPHPRASQRRFVLEPLLELAPRLALHGKSAWEHLQTLDS